MGKSERVNPVAVWKIQRFFKGYTGCFNVWGYEHVTKLLIVNSMLPKSIIKFK